VSPGSVDGAAKGGAGFGAACGPIENGAVAPFAAAAGGFGGGVPNVTGGFGVAGISGARRGGSGGFGGNCDGDTFGGVGVAALVAAVGVGALCIGAGGPGFVPETAPAPGGVGTFSGRGGAPRDPESTPGDVPPTSVLTRRCPGASPSLLVSPGLGGVPGG
jgi:hypothetical protein